ncbi:hypothetical protein RBU60_07255 [Mesonia sp. MT50]|uniref:YcxB-like protein domain-containing protein n=1 Tax=Mesonia profundi TaxID=3070998 RepID=A0ABU1A3W4_9FLAO|nr:hypothetical protein [Mesonia profundi]MDQ7917366.1 hypothetical protein [Mesonia profundi]
MPLKDIPEQRHWTISYWDVGKLLYLSLGLFILESILYGSQLIQSYQNNSTWGTVFWVICFLFSFVHIFLVLMDGWSRFQNYKRVKDQFYIYGFNIKTANHYKGSKCQRNAILVASKELGLEQQAVSFYKRQGIKWYYLIPDFMVSDPFFMIRSNFWARTFMEKKYIPKIDFSKIQSEKTQSTLSIKPSMGD